MGHEITHSLMYQECSLQGNNGPENHSPVCQECSLQDVPSVGEWKTPTCMYAQSMVLGSQNEVDNE